MPQPKPPIERDGSLAVKFFGTSGNRLIQINWQYPLANGLLALFQMEQQKWFDLVQDIRHAVTLLPSVQSAWYYGSVARGEDTQRSDFDIALIAADASQVDAVTETVREALRPLQEKHLVAIPVVGLSLEDASRFIRAEDTWWANMRGDAKPLKGSASQDYSLTITENAA